MLYTLKCVKSRVFRCIRIIKESTKNVWIVYERNHTSGKRIYNLKKRTAATTSEHVFIKYNSPCICYVTFQDDYGNQISVLGNYTY